MSEDVTSQQKIYEKYARTIKTLFFVVGLWPGTGLPKFVKYLVAIYSTTIIIIVFGSINFIINNLSNMAAAIYTMCTCVSACTAIMKVIVYSLYRDDMRRMHESLETTFRNDFTRIELQGVLLSPLNFFYRSTLLMSRTFISLSIAITIKPFISIIIQLARDANPIKYPLVFLLQYPWNPRSSIPIYVVHLLMEGLSAMSTGVSSLSVDVAFGFYIFQIATQFRVLAHRLSLLESDSDYRNLIRECVLRRQILTKCCNCLERAYGPIALWMTISNAISLCANIYQLTKMSADGSMATSLLYIVMKFLQSLFYGWIGTFLTTETESFRNAVYSSGWASSGEKPFMTSILIMLMWKPLVLTACSFSTISLDMFVAILNTAISYFFLLQTIEEGK